MSSNRRNRGKNRRGGSGQEKLAGFTEHQPSGKKGQGPSMKEILQARREGRELEAAPKKLPSKGSPARPARAASAPKRPASGTQRRAHAASVDDGEDAPARRPAGARRAGGTSRSSVRRGTGSARRRRGADDDGDEEEGGGRRRRSQPKKKSALPLVGGLVGMLAVAGGGWWFMNQDKGDETVEAAEKNGEADGDGAAEAGLNPADAGIDPEAVEGATEPEAADPEAADPDAEGDGEAGAAQAADPEAGDPEAGDPEADDPEAGDPEAAESDPKVERSTRSGRYKIFPSTLDELIDPNDPAEPDLAILEPAEPTDDTTEDEWIEIQELVASMADPMAGAAGNRAAGRLHKDFGRKAFPGVINAMLEIDYSNEEGNLTGSVCQKCLETIANGRNVGWNYEFDDRPNITAVLNKRAVELLYNTWQNKLKDDLEAWNKFAKIEQKEKERAGAGEDAGGADDGFGDDDDGFGDDDDGFGDDGP